MHVRRWKLGPLLLILMAVVSGGGALAMAAARLSDDSDHGGRAVLELGVPQRSEASDAGIRILLRSAAFSGTATLAVIEVEIQPVHGLSGAPVVVTVDPGDMAGGSLVPTAGPAGGSIDGKPSARLLLRMGPLKDDSALATIGITALSVRSADGTQVRIEGKWALALSLPPDLSLRLRTEPLAEAAEVLSGGVATRVLGGLRSTTETLLTIRFSGALPADALSEPRLRTADGDVLTGAMLQDGDFSDTATYSFPPTAFGSSVTLEVGPFAKPANGALSFAIDMARVAAVTPFSASTGEAVAIPRSAVLAASDWSLAPVLLSFTRTSSENLEIRLGGPLDPSDRTGATLTLASGAVVRARTRTIGFNRGASGEVIGGQSTLIFPRVEASELRGLLHLTVGPAAEVISGEWKVIVKPGD